MKQLAVIAESGEGEKEDETVRNEEEINKSPAHKQGSNVFSGEDAGMLQEEVEADDLQMLKEILNKDDIEH